MYARYHLGPSLPHHFQLTSPWPAASDETIRAAYFNQTIPNWQIAIPDFGTVTGPFQITALQYDGPYDGELKLSLTLASAGALTFASQ